MFLRILALLILFGLIGGLTFFLLRHDPGKEIDGLRVKIDKLLNSKNPEDWKEVTTSDEQGENDLQQTEIRINIARKASDALLEINPNSVYDLASRGFIEEYAGNLADALQWFDRASLQSNPPAVIELSRSRLLRKLGRFQDAKYAVSSIVDAYPFESNFELGRLHLDTFQAVDAYNSFNRAKDHAKSNGEKAKVMEGVANSLDLLISITRNQLMYAKQQQNENGHITQLSTNLKRLKTERDKVISKAIKYERRIDPKTRSEFANIQQRIFKLISKKQDSNKFKTARQTLREAVASDKGHRDFPLYLLLGYVNLKLAYSDKASDDDKEKLIKEAETNFEKSFSFKFEEKTEDFEYVADWDLADNISPEAFKTHLLLKVCRNILGFPEYRRIVSEEDASGKKDRLKIYERINTALDANKIDASLQHELRLIRSIAFLKNNDLDSYIEEIDRVFNSIPQKETPHVALRIANGMVSFTPNKLHPLISLFDTHVFGSIEKQKIVEGEPLLLINSALEILNRMRNLQYSSFRISKHNLGEEDESKKNDRDLLTQKIREIILSISKNATDSKHFLIASTLMSSLVGVDESVPILEEGKRRFPANVSLHYALGETFFKQAENTTEKLRWTYYSRALREFVVLFKSAPYDSEIVTNMFLIGTRFKDNPTKLKTILIETTEDLFPGCSRQEAEILAKALDALLNKNFETILSQIPEPGEATKVRPFLNLLVGTCYLEMANHYLKKLQAQTPGLTGNLEVSDIRKQFQDLYEKARQEFKNGVAIDKGYLPIWMDLVKMDLDALKKGDEVPETLMKTIKEYVEIYPDIAPTHYLLAVSLKKKLEFLLTEDSDAKGLTKVLSKQRVVLRRAIRADPNFADAYLELADTYVLSWRFSSSGNGGDGISYKNIGSSDFDVATTVLKSAPQVPKVLNRLAIYYKAQNKAKETLKYYKGLFKIDPDESNVYKVIQAYIDNKEFEGARQWLNSIDHSRIIDKHFEMKKSSLLAHIASEEVKSSPVSAEESRLLEDRQIEAYLLTLEKAGELGIEPPPGAVNNLAYLLSNRGDVKKSLELIEPLVEKLQKASGSTPPILLKSVEDTYAWVLHKTGNGKKAVKIYQRLCASETYPEIHMNYARVLFEQKEFNKALKQLEIILKSEQHSPSAEKEARQLRERIKTSLKN